MRPSVHRHIDRGSSTFRVARWVLFGAVVVCCRTPPPLARPAEEPVAPSVAPAPAGPAQPPPPPPPAPRGQKAPPPPPRAAQDPGELAVRYAGRPALKVLRGEASYYGKAFAGRKTASGEVFDPDRFTAAHRSLAFGTVLRVTRIDTKAVVYVRINDRGPFGKARRILDLSTAAADKLDMLRRGIAEVRAEIVEHGKRKPKRSKRKRGRAARK
jgi:rare lipoprotein A